MQIITEHRPTYSLTTPVHHVSPLNPSPPIMLQEPSALHPATQDIYVSISPSLLTLRILNVCLCPWQALWKSFVFSTFQQNIVLKWETKNSKLKIKISDWMNYKTMIYFCLFRHLDLYRFRRVICPVTQQWQRSLFEISRSSTEVGWWGFYPLNSYWHCATTNSIKCMHLPSPSAMSRMWHKVNF